MIKVYQIIACSIVMFVFGGVHQKLCQFWMLPLKHIGESFFVGRGSKIITHKMHVLYIYIYISLNIWILW